jgi:carbon-monoxide dehydrogenase medium subunit
MAIAHEFDYVKPATIEEAASLLAKHGPRARVLAGGTDLIGWLRDDLVQPDVLIDIKGIAGLKDVALRGDGLSVGALATFSDLLDSAIVKERFPLVWEMAGRVGSTGIRNRATVVGNICSAVPCCDAGPVLLVFGAEVRVAGVRTKSAIPITEWFLGPQETSLAQGEIVTGVTLPLPEGSHGGCFVKLGRYRGEDLAQASVAVLALSADEYRVAFGAVAPTPVRAVRIEALLSGRPIDEQLIEDAKSLVQQEIAPITDIRATKEYRARMVSVMLERALKAAASRREGAEPAYGTDLIWERTAGRQP